MTLEIVISRTENGWLSSSGERFPGIKAGSVLRFLRLRYPDARIGVTARDIGPVIEMLCGIDPVLWMKPGCPK